MFCFLFLGGSCWIAGLFTIAVPLHGAHGSRCCCCSQSLSFHTWENFFALIKVAKPHCRRMTWLISPVSSKQMLQTIRIGFCGESMGLHCWFLSLPCQERNQKLVQRLDSSKLQTAEKLVWFLALQLQVTGAAPRHFAKPHSQFKARDEQLSRRKYARG